MNTYEIYTETYSVIRQGKDVAEAIAKFNENDNIDKIIAIHLADKFVLVNVKDVTPSTKGGIRWVKALKEKPTVNGEYICRLIEKNGIQSVKKVEWENNSPTHKEYFDCYVDKWLSEDETPQVGTLPTQSIESMAEAKYPIVDEKTFIHSSNESYYEYERQQSMKRSCFIAGASTLIAKEGSDGVEEIPLFKGTRDELNEL